MRVPSFLLPKQARERFVGEGAAGRPAPRQPGLSATIQRAIRELWAAGWGCPALARLYHLPAEEVRALVLRPRPPVDPAEVLALFEGGMRKRAIAERLGVSRSTVSLALRKARAARQKGD
jgi:hypothetical protein